MNSRAEQRQAARDAAEAFDVALAHLVATTAESVRLQSECPRGENGKHDPAGWSAMLRWDQEHVVPAQAAAEFAWSALRDAVAALGYAAVVVGGRCHFLNANRPELDDMHENAWQFAQWIVDASRVLNLDVEGGAG